MWLFHPAIFYQVHAEAPLHAHRGSLQLIAYKDVRCLYHGHKYRLKSSLVLGCGSGLQGLLGVVLELKNQWPALPIHVHSN